MTECIHGLELERCDACAPRTNAVSERSARSLTPTRARSSQKPSRIASTPPKITDPGARRIFHLTHVSNFESILTAGRVLSEADGARPTVDISTADNRQLRREVSVGSDSVASFVPFFLVPNAQLWEGMRTGAADFRLTDIARTTPAANFIMLVSTARSGGAGSVIADGDAVEPETVFSPLSELGGRMPRTLYDEEDALSGAEFLVPHELAFSAVTLIGVANDKVRAAVRSQLDAHGFSQKVSVYPPWFQRP